MIDNIFSFQERAKISVHIEDCLDYLSKQPENTFDAIITDPPYEIGLYKKKKWDQSGITFSNELWERLFSVLKPGGFIAAFSMPRLYHRMAVAAEDAGFEMYPFLNWKFDGGLPKPINLSELFDRDNIDEREIIGYKKGSGYTKANVDHGAQNRSTTQFPIYARHVSQEAKEWRGFYYGVNTLKPCVEPIMLAQKPIETKRVIDNIRKWKTGALNIDALKQQYSTWPNTILEHKKAKKSDHHSNHPSVKPTLLMQDLCMLLCPYEGIILDPFAGTGTTGVAAKNLGLNCVLIEQNIDMKKIIEHRISA